MPTEHPIPLAEKWAAAQEEIRRLAEQLSTVEGTNKKLAQSLHDDLAQLLVVARMKLQHQRDRPADATVKEIDTVLARCLTYTRCLISDLVPPQLQEGRLDIALQWLSDPMREHGLIVNVEVPAYPVVVPEHTAMTILKCVRELLFNVLKHAGTNEALVSLEVSGDLIRVVVQDHGKGYTATVAEPFALHSFGLSSVQQRLHLLGGRLEITSQPGVGTRATVTAPFASLPSA